MHRFLIAPGILLLALCTGCGDGTAGVHGTVAFNGKPVKSGSITFVSVEGPLIRAGAVISDGSFGARVPSGKYKVELNAQHVVGKRTQKGFDGKDEELEITEELFPERYNVNTELTETIKSGDNKIAYDVKP
jgi:hypothetical protein